MRRRIDGLQTLWNPTANPELYTRMIKSQGVSEDHSIAKRVTEENNVPEFPWLLDFCVNNTTTVDTEKVDNLLLN